MRQKQRNKVNIFQQNPQVGVNRSKFDLSHEHLSTGNSDDLIPIMCQEVIPGDTHIINAEVFSRLNTPINPIFTSIFQDTFFFFVPMRLVWNNFQKFMGEQDNPADSIDFLEPTMTAPGAGYGEETMMDYLGIPTKVGSLEHRSLPLRAIHKIYNEWYRDENIQDSVHLDSGDGPDTYTN